MRLLILSLLLMAPLAAKPYFSQYRGNGSIIYFHGEVKDEDENRAKVLQTQYLESGDRTYLWELYKLGVDTTIIPDNSPHSENTYPYEHPPQYNSPQKETHTHTIIVPHPVPVPHPDHPPLPIPTPYHVPVLVPPP